MKKILNVAETVRFGADRLDELARARINATLRCAVAFGLGDKDRRQLFVRASVGCLKGRKPNTTRIHCANLSSTANARE